MPTTYTYELINGRGKVVGYYTSRSLPKGKYIVFYILKEPYNQDQSVTFLVPLKTKLVSSNGVEYTYRMYLDVTGLSKRQIAVIKSYV